LYFALFCTLFITQKEESTPIKTNIHAVKLYLQEPKDKEVKLMKFNRNKTTAYF